ncbi:MAG: PEP-CTERM sorting domain-containing protein [Verrucomicrobiota bacterium]
MKHLILIILLTASASRAELFGFNAITANDTNGTAQIVGESQLFMDVTSTGEGQVSVLFTNTGPASSAISEIYFSTLDPDVAPPVSLEIVSVINGPGVSFVDGDVAPPNPPGGELIGWMCTDEAAGSEKAAKNAIDPYEYLILEMTYTEPPYNFLDMLHSGDLQVALHVIDMGAGGEFSETFVNVIPEPASMVLLLGTSGLIAFVRRKFSV